MPHPLFSIKSILLVNFFSISLAIPAWGESRVGKSRDLQKTKQFCSERELRTKGCALRLDSWQIQVSRTRILAHNGVWRSLEKTPLSEVASEWERVEVRVLGGRTLVVMYVWGPAEGLVQSQYLQWHVFELEEKAIVPRISQEVRKRRIQTKQEAKPSSKIKYLYDPENAHALSVLPQGKIGWKVGLTAGEF